MRLIPCVLLLAAATSTGALAADRGEIAAAKLDLRVAADSASAPGAVKARARFQALSAAEPDDALLHLWVASATWRAVPLLQRSEPQRAERLLRDGLQHVDEAIRLAPKDGEALALKAALQGLLMRFEPGSMMTLGPESAANLSRAQVLSPESPRVWFLRGIQTLHTPAQFGGSPVRAREELERAIALFARDSVSDSPALDWGRGDAYLWAGQASMQSGDTKGAVSFFEQALAHDPDNRWVQQLLPAARDSLAKGKP
jgi:tetratricopeptide (TPR) repeat protein